MSIRAMVLALVMIGAPGIADEPKPSARERMKQLEFMTGEWRGEGWMQRGEKRETFKSQEDVRFGAGGHVLLIEGHHTGFEAAATVHFDEKSGTYRFRSFTSEGRTGETELKLVGDRKAEWSPSPNIRYTIDMTDPERWVEIGEFSRDGKEWRKFFEMTLEK